MNHIIEDRHKHVWHFTAEGSPPVLDEEVLGVNKDWIDENNLRGIRLCKYLTKSEKRWINIKITPIGGEFRWDTPTYWCYLVSVPKEVYL